MTKKTKKTPKAPPKTFDELIEQKYGPKGTPKREQYEKEYRELKTALKRADSITMGS